MDAEKTWETAMAGFMFTLCTAPGANCGPWSNRIDAWKPIHYAILNHFNLH